MRRVREAHGGACASVSEKLLGLTISTTCLQGLLAYDAKRTARLLRRTERDLNTQPQQQLRHLPRTQEQKQGE